MTDGTSEMAHALPLIRPCSVCQSTKWAWKTWAEKDWFIHCDSCGNTGLPGHTQWSAAHNWNDDLKGDTK